MASKILLGALALIIIIAISAIVSCEDSSITLPLEKGETYHFILPISGETANPYRLAVIGDSVAWGNGLNQEHKYYNLVAKWLRTILGKPVEVLVYAHSGAVISGAFGQSVKNANLNSEYPSLKDQAENVPNNIDLILVSGGINDVGIANILDPKTSKETIKSRSEDIQKPMTELLMYLMDNTKPDAKIMVTGYYPIITDDSKLGLRDRASGALLARGSEASVFQALVNLAASEANPILGAAVSTWQSAKEIGINLGNLIENDALFKTNSYIFYSTSFDSLLAAVTDANKAVGGNRIAFIDPLFQSNNGYRASDSYLWEFKPGMTIEVNDEQYVERSKLTDNPIDIANALAHPNVKGASRYADMINASLKSKMSDWFESATDSTLPTVATLQKDSSAAISDSAKRSYLDGYGNLVRQTLDGGYIIIGKIFFDKDKGGVWLIKTDANGNMMWDKTFGEDPNDEGHSVRQTTDGGYILAGYTNAGDNKDGWLIKTDADGNMLWDKTLGEPEREESARSVRQTLDGGYIVAGYAESDSFPNRERWLIETDANGDMLWEKTLGGGLGSYTDQSIQQTSDEGYILAGNTVINKPGQGPSQVPWLVKTDANGDILWERTFEQSNVRAASPVLETTDGGYIVAGGFGADGLGLIKTDADGNMLWDRTFDESNAEINSVQQTSDGGYVIAGASSGPDLWLAKTDADGNKLWDKTFGGSNIDWAQSVQLTDDGCYILAGYTVSDKASKGMVWLIKVDVNGNMLWDKTFGGAESE